MYFSENNETDQIIIIETFENVQTKWHWSKNFSGIYSHHLTSVTLTTLGTGAGITLCYDHQWQHQDCSNVWDWCQWRIQESLVTCGCNLVPTMISVSIIKQWSMWLILFISLVLVQNIKWKLYNHQEQFSSSQLILFSFLSTSPPTSPYFCSASSSLWSGSCAGINIRDLTSPSDTSHKVSTLTMWWCESAVMIRSVKMVISALISH